ncbi:hypothetical protein CK203_037586 [Vitis vinifera]|uniref:Uncharacterized protein n=1 Tax=Vitis vinifera TaxID=29760 RepID=A0A438HMD5_VITVI|nr:hypothetical protein CK203_037586 [Vitis vinifera]
MRCLQAINIRDNGFILLRNEEILYESPVGNANDSPGVC